MPFVCSPLFTPLRWRVVARQDVFRQRHVTPLLDAAGDIFHLYLRLCCAAMLLCHELRQREALCARSMLYAAMRVAFFCATAMLLLQHATPPFADDAPFLMLHARFSREEVS